MALSSPASRLPIEIWDIICGCLDVPGTGSHPRHGYPSASWDGQRDLKSVRLVNRAACQSASCLVFRSIGQKQSHSGVRALSQLAGSRYASSVRAALLDLEDDLAWGHSFDSDVISAVDQTGPILARFPKLNTLWVVKYPLTQSHEGRSDWSGMRSKRSDKLASRWIEMAKSLGIAQLAQLNLVFDSMGRMKQFSNQLNQEYPEGPDGWFQAVMLEETTARLKDREAHDTRSILSVMPLNGTGNNRLEIAGSSGRAGEYRSYRLLQYIPARPQLESLHLSGVDLDGNSLERIILSNAQTLKSIELFGVTLRTTYWSDIFVTTTECCTQLKSLEVGCLGYLLPISAILSKMSKEYRDTAISADTGALTFLLQTIAARRWEDGMPPMTPNLLRSACDATLKVTEASREFLIAIESIEGRRSEGKPCVEQDPVTVTNEVWEDMLWLQAQLWEG